MSPEIKQNCDTCQHKTKAFEDEPCNTCEQYRDWKPSNWDEATPFQPDYFSGLNWREAEKLVGKVVEFSDNGDGPWETGELYCVRSDNNRKFFIKDSGFSWEYIRTCPETHAHPTITIGGVELPKPEIEAPEKGADIFVLGYDTVHKTKWECLDIDKEWLQEGRVHLTEPRAQAWASWWQDTVVKAVQS